MFSAGLWRLRDDLAAVTGARVARRFLSTRGLDAVAGWGFKPTALRARRIAAATALPYLAVEDGFLRSRAPGEAEPSVSYVCDRRGVYYDAAGPSDLEALIMARRADPGRAERDAGPAFDALRRLGVSKYNLFDSAARRAARGWIEAGGHVLVVDQTVGDAAVTGAGANRDAFRAMLVAAIEENPDRPVLIKTHPETQTGRRGGYFDTAMLAEAAGASPAAREALTAGRVRLLTERLSPADLCRGASRVYAVSSLMGFEALIHGAPVTLFGQSFYAGWGLTDDRAAPVARRMAAPLGCLVAAAYLDYPVYLTPGDRRVCDLERIAAHLATPPG